MSNKHCKLHSKHHSCRLFVHQPFKVNMPNMITYLNWTPIFEWYVFGCGFKNIYQKSGMFKWDRTMCSNYYNYSRLNHQHDWKELYDHSMITRIFTSIMINTFIRALKIMRMWLCPWFGFANHLILKVCFIS